MIVDAVSRAQRAIAPAANKRSAKP
jgi:hypothetical protein